MSAINGKVQTVLGLIKPEELGRTMVHEHLSMNFQKAFINPGESQKVNSENPFSLETIGWIQYHPYSHHSNLILNDIDASPAILEELKHFKNAGGSSVVECTTYGIQRDAKFLHELSLSTGLNIIAGTGYYVASFQQELLPWSEEQLAQLMHDEIFTGCKEASDVRCGLIGELGCSFPLQSFERKVLSAAAQVQQDAKCPVSIHPGRDASSPTEVLRVFQEAGGDAKRVAVCHLDRTLLHDDELLEFAKHGSFLEFDLFGVECSYYQLNRKEDMPSDAQRIKFIRQLVFEGYEDKILLSQDIHTKHRLTKFGGHGYSHVLTNIAPRMIDRGIPPQTVDKFLIHNPAAWLTFQ